jgi:hypothetical protein
VRHPDGVWKGGGRKACRLRDGAAPEVVMSASGPEVDIVEIDRAEITVESWSWPFAVARREEIDRHFATRQRERPALWNGRVLLLNRYTIRDCVLRGACFETDYASFLAWRDWDFVDAGAFNVFAAGALQSADGAFLLGEMAAHTASAGEIYFPCGTPDGEDIAADGSLDLAGSLRRELLEETGMDAGMLAAAPGWSLVRDGCYLGLLKRLTAPQPAHEVRAAIKRYLARQAEPEFCDIHIVRGATDLNARMPRFMVRFLQAAWSS